MDLVRLRALLVVVRLVVLVALAVRARVAPADQVHALAGGDVVRAVALPAEVDERPTDAVAVRVPPAASPSAFATPHPDADVGVVGPRSKVPFRIMRMASGN